MKSTAFHTTGADAALQTESFPTRAGWAEYVLAHDSAASLESFAERCCGNPYALLNKLGFPPETHGALAHFVKQAGAAQAVLKLAAARALGIPPDEIAHYFRTRPEKLSDNLLYLDQPYQAAACPQPAALQFGLSEPGRPLSLFPAMFRLVEAGLLEKGDQRGFDRFFMQLSPEQHAELLDRLAPAEDDEQLALCAAGEEGLPFAVAQMRIQMFPYSLCFAIPLFERLEQTVQSGSDRDLGKVMMGLMQQLTAQVATREPSSKLFEALEAQGAIGEYSDWREYMLASFEAMASGPGQGVGVCTLFAGDQSPHLERWERLGYSHTRGEGRSLMKKDFGAEPVAAWRKACFHLSETVFPRFLRVYEELCEEYLWTAQPGEHLLISQPLPGRLLIDGCDLSAAVKQSFDYVPQIPLAAESLTGMTAELASTWRSLLACRELRPMAEALPPEFTLTSKGKEGGVSARWWELAAGPPLGWSAAGLHIPGQDRHPTLRLFRHDRSGAPASSICIGFKGGGLREFMPQEIWAREREELKGRRYPIYPHQRKKGEPEIPSHKYWGGISLLDAEMEFVHTVAAHHLAEIAGLEDEIELPVPLQIGVPLALPGWGEDGVHWRGIMDYCDDIIGTRLEARERIGSYVSLYRCDVRLSQLYNHIFGGPDPGTGDLRSSILDGLRYLYWAHGEQLRDPGRPIAVPEDRLGAVEVLHFLRLVHRANREAAERILERIALNSLRFAGLVHGAGGHLGGSRTRLTFGGVSGGALAMRNLDLRGGVHDLDRDIYLPWFNWNMIDREARLVQQAHAGRMQFLDLVHWRHSVYWAAKLLRGIALDRRAEIHPIHLGKFDLFHCLEAHPREIFHFKQLLAGKLDELPPFDLGSYQGEYERCRELGRKAAS